MTARVAATTTTKPTEMTTLTIELPTHLAEAMDAHHISSEMLTAFVVETLEKMFASTGNGDEPLYPLSDEPSTNGQNLDGKQSTRSLAESNGYYTTWPGEEGSALGEKAGETIPGANGATLKLKDGRVIPAAYIIAPSKSPSPWVRGDLVKDSGERVLGLHEGMVWMSDDFDEPLPDEFWFGE